MVVLYSIDRLFPLHNQLQSVLVPCSRVSDLQQLVLYPLAVDLLPHLPEFGAGSDIVLPKHVCEEVGAWTLVVTCSRGPKQRVCRPVNSLSCQIYSILLYLYLSWPHHGYVAHLP